MSAASASSIRNSRAGSRNCMSTRPARPCAAATRCSRSTVPISCSPRREYLVARSAAADMAHADPMARDNANAIAAAALSRLRNWDISADQLARLQRTGTAARTLTLAAPIGGIVMDKQALAGLHFGAGDLLYRIVD